MRCSIRPPERADRACAAALRDGGIELSVRDGGAGVPQDELTRIFDKRYRGSNAAGCRVTAWACTWRARSSKCMAAMSAWHNVAPSGAEFRIWLPAQRQRGKVLRRQVINSDNSAESSARVGGMSTENHARDYE